MEQAELVLDDVGDGLSICGGARAAAPDGVVDAGQLVGHSVGDVCAGGGSGVGACTVGEGGSQPNSSEFGRAGAREAGVPSITPSLKVTAML